MKKKLILLLGLMMFVVVGLAGCAKTSMNGVYKTTSDYSYNRHAENQPFYLLFKKNGQAYAYQPESNKEYGEALKGTWKSIGNYKFKMHMKSTEDNKDYTVVVTKNKNGKTITTSESPERQYCEYRKNDMDESEFMTNFKQAKVSESDKVQENGYYQSKSSTDNNQASNYNSSIHASLTDTKATAAIAMVAGGKKAWSKDMFDALKGAGGIKITDNDNNSYTITTRNSDESRDIKFSAEMQIKDNKVVCHFKDGKTVTMTFKQLNEAYKNMKYEEVEMVNSFWDSFNNTSTNSSSSSSSESSSADDDDDTVPNDLIGLK